MQKSDNTIKAQSAHRRLKTSTTLNRKYVKRPTKSADVSVHINKTSPSPRIQKFNYPISNNAFQKAAQPKQSDVTPSVAHPIQTAARARMATRANQTAQPQAPKMTAKELKEQAIQKALASTNNATMAATMSSKSQKSKITKFGTGRIILALSCAAAAVFAIAYFVNLNAPDISLRVAAMQTGINASFPSYVPRDYKLSSVTSENAKISLDFKNSATQKTFSLIEEKSSWDSNALLNNYIKPTFNDNYTIIREQGLTIYVSNSNAAWVNGGAVFKITADSDTLTAKQIRSIAVSL